MSDTWRVILTFCTALGCGLTAGVFFAFSAFVMKALGSLLYLVGCVLVTIVFNVPRNDVLARIDPASADAARAWTGYVSGWTAWNHVRTVAALAAAALFTTAFCLERVR